MLSDDDMVGAVFALGMAKERHPKLAKAEHQARLALASSIIDYDTNGWSPSIDVEITQASQNYAQALPDLLRGDYR